MKTTRTGTTSTNIESAICHRKSRLTVSILSIILYIIYSYYNTIRNVVNIEIGFRSIYI